MDESVIPLGRAVRSPPWLHANDEDIDERELVRGASLDEEEEQEAGSSSETVTEADQIQRLKLLLSAVAQHASARGHAFDAPLAAELSAALYPVFPDDNESEWHEQDVPGTVAEGEETEPCLQPPPPPQSWTAASEQDHQFSDNNDEEGDVEGEEAEGIEAPAEPYSRGSSFSLQQQTRSASVDEWDNDDDIGYVTVHISEEDFYAMEEEAALEAEEFELEEAERAEEEARRAAYHSDAALLHAHYLQEDAELSGDDGSRRSDGSSVDSDRSSSSRHSPQKRAHQSVAAIVEAGSSGGNSSSSSSSSGHEDSDDGSSIEADLALAEAALHAANAAHSDSDADSSSSNVVDELYDVAATAGDSLIDGVSLLAVNSSVAFPAFASVTTASAATAADISSSSAGSAAVTAAGAATAGEPLLYDAASGGLFSDLTDSDQLAQLAAQQQSLQLQSEYFQQYYQQQHEHGCSSECTHGAAHAASQQQQQQQQYLQQQELLLKDESGIDAAFDALLHTLALESPPHGGAGGSLGPCSALTVESDDDPDVSRAGTHEHALYAQQPQQQGSDAAVPSEGLQIEPAVSLAAGGMDSQSPFPTAVSQSSDGGSYGHNSSSTANTAAWHSQSGANAYAFGHDNAADDAAGLSESAADQHSGSAEQSDISTDSANTDALQQQQLCDDSIDIDDGESLPDEAYEEPGGPEDDALNTETFGAAQVFNRAPDGSVILPRHAPRTPATAGATCCSGGHDHSLSHSHSHSHAHSYSHRDDVSSDVRSDVSGAHLGSANGSLGGYVRYPRRSSTGSGESPRSRKTHNPQKSAPPASTHSSDDGDHVSIPGGHVSASSASYVYQPEGSYSAHSSSGGRVHRDLDVDVDNDDETDSEYAVRLGMTADADLGTFALKVIYERGKTGFEESKHFRAPVGAVIAGRYKVEQQIGAAAFSTTLQCEDLQYVRASTAAAAASRSNGNKSAYGNDGYNNGRAQRVCLKVIKNNKDFFDQSLDEIKLLQRLSKHGDPDVHHVLSLIDYFYYKEHLFIVSELLQQNLYEFGKRLRSRHHQRSGSARNGLSNGSSAGCFPEYFTPVRLARIATQCLEALAYINSLGLMHCDVKPENIVMRSYTDVTVKLIDFGSSCYTTDRLPMYAQSRSYRAPEVVLGMEYGPGIDVWSLGAVLAELITGTVLFQNDSVTSMLARITAIVGDLPPYMVLQGREAFKYYTSAGVLYERARTEHAHDSSHNDNHSQQQQQQQQRRADNEGFTLLYPKATSLAARLRYPDPQAVHFITQLLNPDPEFRPSAKSALQHPWIVQNRDVPLEELQYPAF